jgi:hypothetical protein
MLDVAAVALAWFETVNPRIPALPEGDAALSATLAALVALHDIGKFSRPFQAKRRDLWPARLGEWRT